MPETYTPHPQSTRCLDPDHKPANFIVRRPGHYTHTCPSCGKVEEFDVNEITY